MNTITYTLSTEGQRVCLLAGGDGKSSQTLTIERDDPNFPRYLSRAYIDAQGGASLQIPSACHSGGLSFDSPQTLVSLLVALDAQDAKLLAERANRVEAKRIETLNVLTERRTRRHEDMIGVNREGELVPYGYAVQVTYCYETAQWPFAADPLVIASPESVAWVAELEAARAAALSTAVGQAVARLPELAAAEAAKAARVEAIITEKIAMGGVASDFLCRIKDGALVSVPVWEAHSRGKNWLALISTDPTQPGGLARAFAPKAKGDSYYIVPPLTVGQAVEFGADYYSGGGRKTARRWYGYIVAVTANALLLRPCDSGKTACNDSTNVNVAK